jgi:hypothetical protein
MVPPLHGDYFRFSKRGPSTLQSNFFNYFVGRINQIISRDLRKVAPKPLAYSAETVVVLFLAPPGDFGNQLVSDAEKVFLHNIFLFDFYREKPGGGTPLETFGVFVGAGRFFPVVNLLSRHP